ncbi:hypothetical protein M5D96_014251, partial [Drosophila gunungcola]
VRARYSFKDYYFIPRKGWCNPGGKLYSRYRNQRSRKKKMERNSLERVMSETERSDLSICKAYKLTLNYTCDDWKAVRDI